jgi:hypothetical protein
MASQVHWGSNISLTLYLQPTWGVAIQALESKVYEYCPCMRIFYDMVNESRTPLLKLWSHAEPQGEPD